MRYATENLDFKDQTITPSHREFSVMWVSSVRLKYPQSYSYDVQQAFSMVQWNKLEKDTISFKIKELLQMNWGHVQYMAIYKLLEKIRLSRKI